MADPENPNKPENNPPETEAQKEFTEQLAKIPADSEPLRGIKFPEREQQEEAPPKQEVLKKQQEKPIIIDLPADERLQKKIAEELGRNIEEQEEFKAIIEDPSTPEDERKAAEESAWDVYYRAVIIDRLLTNGGVDSKTLEDELIKELGTEFNQAFFNKAVKELNSLGNPEDDPYEGILKEREEERHSGLSPERIAEEDKLYERAKKILSGKPNNEDEQKIFDSLKEVEERQWSENQKRKVSSDLMWLYEREHAPAEEKNPGSKETKKQDVEGRGAYEGYEKERREKLTKEEREREDELVALAEKILVRKDLDEYDQKIAYFIAEAKNKDWPNAMKEKSMRDFAQQYEKRHEKTEPNLKSENFYERLGVSKNDYAEDIKNAHRRLVRQFHPDKRGDPDDFKAVNEAYKILINPEKRAEYDTKLEAEEIRKKVEEAVSNIEDKDAEDPVISSSWVKRGKEAFKFAALGSLVLTKEGVKSLKGIMPEGSTLEGVRKKSAEFAAMGLVIGIGSIWLLIRNIFEFVKEAAKGKMNFAAGYKLGHDIIGKKDKK